MHKKMTLLILICLVLWSCPLGAKNFRWGFVDGRRLIRMHPLMQQYDPQTRRFVDTVSQPRPSEDPTDYIARLQLRLNSMKTMIAALDASYAGKINDRGMAARKAWWSFWKKRESLKIYQNLVQEAINQAAVHGNFYLNFPSDWTMMPVARAIAGSVDDACEYLRSGHKLDIVFDTSVFSSNLAGISVLDMVPNPHWKVWSGQPLNSGDMQIIGNSMGSAIRKTFPGLRNKPFLAGAMDLRALSESLLSDITLPTADLPGDDQKYGD